MCSPDTVSLPFSTAENPVEGVSAVKALKIANDQGIPIYTVNQGNITTVLPQLQVDQQVKDDIANAVNTGKIVTVSKTNINFNGWIGCGYIIIDPTTGAGAYKISGGENGAAFRALLWVIDVILHVTAAAGMMAIAYLAAMCVPIIAGFVATLSSAVYAGAIFIANLYLVGSMKLASNPWTMALYADLMAWAELSPPPPFPSTPTQIFNFILMYFMYFRIYLNAK